MREPNAFRRLAAVAALALLGGCSTSTSARSRSRTSIRSRATIRCAARTTIISTGATRADRPSSPPPISSGRTGAAHSTQRPRRPIRPARPRPRPAPQRPPTRSRKPLRPIRSTRAAIRRSISRRARKPDAARQAAPGDAGRGARRSARHRVADDRMPGGALAGYTDRVEISANERGQRAVTLTYHERRAPRHLSLHRRTPCLDGARRGAAAAGKAAATPHQEREEVRAAAMSDPDSPEFAARRLAARARLDAMDDAGRERSVSARLVRSGVRDGRRRPGANSLGRSSSRIRCSPHGSRTTPRRRARRARSISAAGLATTRRRSPRRAGASTGFDLSPRAIAWAKPAISGTRILLRRICSQPPAGGMAPSISCTSATPCRPCRTRRAREAMRQIARFVRPGGTLLVIARARDGSGPAAGPPWPLTRDERHDASTTHGLRAESIEQLARSVRRQAALARGVSRS